MMVEIALAKLLGYSVFWSSDLRRRFRNRLLWWIWGVKYFIFSSSLKALPRSQGERLVERRVSMFGVSIFVRRWQRPYYRVALLVDEFFGGWDTAIGGYGALARKYICRYIPNEKIQVDVLLNVHPGTGIQQKRVDQTTIFRLPAHPMERQRWLDGEAFDLFLSIELTQPSFEIMSEYETDAPLLYWIQDPRDTRRWRSRLRTVGSSFDAAQ